MAQPTGMETDQAPLQNLLLKLEDVAGQLQGIAWALDKDDAEFNAIYPDGGGEHYSSYNEFNMRSQLLLVLRESIRANAERLIDVRCQLGGYDLTPRDDAPSPAPHNVVDLRPDGVA
jgi:hypothetical protein